MRRVGYGIATAIAAAATASVLFLLAFQGQCGTFHVVMLVFQSAMAPVLIPAIIGGVLAFMFGRRVLFITTALFVLGSVGLAIDEAMPHAVLSDSAPECRIDL